VAGIGRLVASQKFLYFLFSKKKSYSYDTTASSILHNVASDFPKVFPSDSSKLQLSLKGKENWAVQTYYKSNDNCAFLISEYMEDNSSTVCLCFFKCTPNTFENVFLFFIWPT